MRYTQRTVLKKLTRISEKEGLFREADFPEYSAAHLHLLTPERRGAAVDCGRWPSLPANPSPGRFPEGPLFPARSNAKFFRKACGRGHEPVSLNALNRTPTSTVRNVPRDDVAIIIRSCSHGSHPAKGPVETVPTKKASAKSEGFTLIRRRPAGAPYAPPAMTPMPKSEARYNVSTAVGKGGKASAICRWLRDYASQTSHFAE